MNKNEFASRVSEKTGLDIKTSTAVLTKIEEYDIFGKEDQAKVRAAIAETAGCSEDKAEEIRKDILSTMKGVIKHQIPKAIVSAVLFIGAAILAVRFIRRRK